MLRLRACSVSNEFLRSSNSLFRSCSSSSFACGQATENKCSSTGYLQGISFLPQSINTTGENVIRRAATRLFASRAMIAFLFIALASPYVCDCAQRREMQPLNTLIWRVLSFVQPQQTHSRCERTR